jgi:hypothetical protein
MTSTHRDKPCAHGVPVKEWDEKRDRKERWLRHKGAKQHGKNRKAKENRKG